MTRAIQLARRASFYVHPNPRVGCVLVRNDRIIAEGWHSQVGEDHAEIMAIKSACAESRNSSCYVTLEPCAHVGKTPPCVDTLIEAGISEVYVAMLDPNPQVSGQGIARLQMAGINVRTGLMQDEAEQLNLGFLKRMRTGLPYVRCKMGMSLDGRIALANGASQWITSAPSRRNVHLFRARSAAILTGINTILSDDPALTVRDIDSAGYQPLRVIIDSQLSLNKEASVLNQIGRTLIFTLSNDDQRIQQLSAKDVKIIHGNELNGHIDLKMMFYTLAEGYKVNEVLVEAGPTLSGKLIDQGLVDEVILYAAPLLLGDNSRGLFGLPIFESLDECIELNITDIRKFGEDVRISAHIANTEENG